MVDNILYKDYFLTDNKSGWKCVPKKLEKNNPELFQKIENFLNTSNIPEHIDSYIQSNTSHFNKNNNKKLEVIVKLNFK